MAISITRESRNESLRFLKLFFVRNSDKKRWKFEKNVRNVKHEEKNKSEATNAVCLSVCL